MGSSMYDIVSRLISRLLAVQCIRQLFACLFLYASCLKCLSLAIMAAHQQAEAAPYHMTVLPASQTLCIRT